MDGVSEDLKQIYSTLFTKGKCPNRMLLSLNARAMYSLSWMSSVAVTFTFQAEKCALTLSHQRSMILSDTSKMFSQPLDLSPPTEPSIHSDNCTSSSSQPLTSFPPTLLYSDSESKSQPRPGIQSAKKSSP